MIGFIGLGIMGKPMVRNLQKAGEELLVYDIDSTALAQMTGEGFIEAKSCREVAEKSDVIILMLPNSPHVEEAVLGPDGVLEGMRKNAVIIDMSSIAPASCQKIAAEVVKKGGHMLDAPVSGGEPKAIDGTLAIMVGGEETIFEKVKDILLKMGASAVYVGPIGSGNIAKLANQMIVALNIAAMSEALVLSKKAGVDPEKVFQAIRGGLAGSTVLEAKAPKLLSGDHSPGFRIELHIKDIDNALQTAHNVGVPVPLTSSVFEIMQALKVAGKEKNDHSGIAEFYEQLANVTVRQTP